MKHPRLCEIRSCFEGVVPAVIATSSGDGVPNVTYLSKVSDVDEDHVALSNQFFSKTTRNLAENPQASILLVSPEYDQYRLTLRYERTEHRGPVFEDMTRDIEAIAALTHMQGVFKLKTADVYRVTSIERYPALPLAAPCRAESRLDPTALGELSGRLARCHDLEAVVGTALAGLAELFGYEHSLLMLLDEQGSRLYTIATHGYDGPGVGSEVAVGEGVMGMAAARCSPMRVGNLGQMRKYSHTVRRSFEEHGAIEPGQEIPMPAFPRAQSQLAVPAMVRGQLVGVLAVESPERVAFDDADEALVGVVAGLIAGAIEVEWAYERAAEAVGAPGAGAKPEEADRGLVTHVRHFPVDGSTFFGPVYVIKGVAGEILWSLLTHYTREGRTEFTNREVRLDPSLSLPEVRDNLESRLILLKRRLEERHAPIRLEKVGRGRFRLIVTGALRLEVVGDARAK